MSIAKKYVKSKGICKATFRVSKTESGGAKSVFLVGEFNGWTMHAMPMKKQKDGSFRLVVDLPSGREYQFWYLLDDERWENDWNADKYAYSSFGNCENSVVEV